MTTVLAQSKPRNFWQMLYPPIAVDELDFAFLILLGFCTIAYHQNIGYWSGQTTVGTWQYGDADFWWSGAIQFAEGIIRDNPNLTYRMGYAVVAGLWVALFGTEFSAFHAFLLTAFIIAWYALYLLMRPSISKLASAGAILLIALSPYTAEWLAISTSDSVGLLFNTWMLVCLIAGLRRGLSPLLTAGAGLCLSFSSLTRPLMTPFLGPAVLLLLVATKVDWKRRLRGILALVIAFAIPTLIWMAVLRSLTGSWKLAGSEASTFYAASDPQIQVWTPSMYEKVESSGKARFNVSQLSPSQIDDEYQRLTFKNYFEFKSYHLRRIIPHLVAMAGMSIDKATHVDFTSSALRFLILSMFAIALCRDLFKRHQPRKGLLVLGTVLIWLLVPSVVVLLAAVSLLYVTALKRSQWEAAMFVAYWFSGAGGLYLVGGTWGPPLSAVTSLNALGYRLGAQFYFAADVIVMYFLCSIHGVWIDSPVASTWFSSVTASRRWASAAVSRGLVVGLGLLLFGTTLGTATVAYRWLSRSVGASRPFPNTMAVLKICTEQIRKFLKDAQPPTSVEIPESLLAPDGNSPYVLVTGASTDFVWNLIGQNRAKLMMALQTKTSPFDFARRILVDIPQSVNETDWTRRQGAWLLRRIKDDPPLSTLPWYISDVAVRAFIPISKDGTTFEAAKAEWFPIVKYASQLHSANELIVESGVLQFSGTSGAEHYPRRFSLKPATEGSPVPPAIVIDAAKAVGKRDLKFRWQGEMGAGGLPRTVTMRIQAFDANAPPGAQVLERAEDLKAAKTLTVLQATNIDLDKPPTHRVRVGFEGLRPGDTIWIYELNVAADDWAW